MQKVLSQTSWQPLPFAILTTLISYFCISYSFGRVSKLLGIRMSLRDLTSVGFVSTVLNHVITSGGAAGYSVRILLMNRPGVSVKDVLTASILHYYLTSLVMIAMLPIGIAYIILHASISQAASIALSFIAFMALVTAAFATSLIFWSSVRRKALTFLTKVARKLIHRDIGPTLANFDTTMTRSVKDIRRQPRKLILIMTLVIIDWATSATTLWFCFRALDTTVNVGELISGFVIGIAAGIISLIPGGLGVQEASMAGVFSLVGISFQRAALASILFRVVYLMTPYVVSLVFYYRLLRTRKEQPILNDLEVEHAHPDSESWVPPND
jgi:uncharacterized protein (TIRG00374 family)